MVTYHLCTQIVYKKCDTHSIAFGGKYHYLRIGIDRQKEDTDFNYGVISFV